MRGEAMAEQVKEINRQYFDRPGDFNPNGENQVIMGLVILGMAVRDNNFEKGWRSPDSPARNFGELIALLHSEVSEAFESYRNGEPTLWYKHNVPGFIGEPFSSKSSIKYDGKTFLGKPEGIAAELADVIIRVLDMADELNLPLIDALLDKHAYNRTRPYRHGGKKA